ncbi:MAG: restriction endonuclease subunit S [Gammaproteobacteria bacterium]|nr:restriction endonuclease subunit S [Gammaproteobacteria bacterium]
MNQAWTWCSLSELFEIGAGKTMSPAARNGLDKTPFLRTSNVFWDDIDLASVDEMSVPTYEMPAKLLRQGDLVVCEGGEIGRAAVWDGRVETISFQNHLHRLRPAVPDVEPRFYVFFLWSAFTQLGLYEGVGNKTTIPNLSRGRLAELQVPIPSFNEQRAITAALGQIRDAIRRHKQITLLSQNLKRAAMQTLFTHGVRGEVQKETEIGPMPESWKIASFASVRKKLQYGTSVRCNYDPTNRPVLRIPNIEPQRINSNDLKYCKLAGKDAAKYRLEKNDLIFIRTNGVLDRLGSCAVYTGHPVNALFASYLIRARIKLDQANPHFVAYFFSSEMGTNAIARRATPASDGKFNLNTAIINGLPLPLPPTLSEQREIVAILDAIDRKIDLHRRKRALLEDLFKTLLHKLMTGKVAIEDMDLTALKEN